MNAELGAAPTTKLSSQRAAMVPKLGQLHRQEGRWPKRERGRGRAELRWWARSSCQRTTIAFRSPQPDRGALGLGVLPALACTGCPQQIEVSALGLADCIGQRLTCELSGPRQRGTRPARQMINLTAARAWCHAVGAPLERGVRPHRVRNPEKELTALPPHLPPIPRVLHESAAWREWIA